MPGTYKTCRECLRFEYHKRIDSIVCEKCTKIKKRAERKSEKKDDEDEQMSIIY